MNTHQLKENMKTRLTALLLGLALTATVHAQNVSTVISSNLFEPNSVTTDPNNVAYVTDGANNRIVKFDGSSGTMTSLAGFTGVSGSDNGAGISALFFQPAGIV
jgi:sugar lactone lactonase YvrE